MKRIVVILIAVMVGLAAYADSGRTTDNNNVRTETMPYKGQKKKDVVAMWGRPQVRSRIMAPTTIKRIIVWEYRSKGYCVVFFGGKVEGVVDMTKAGPWGKNYRR